MFLRSAVLPSPQAMTASPAAWMFLAAFTFEELKRLAGLQRNMTNDEFAKPIA